MKKIAMTYCSNPTRKQLGCVEFFKSGTEALQYFYENVSNFSNSPIIWEKKPKQNFLSSPTLWKERPKQLGKTGIVVRHGFINYHCRFLTNKEVKIYEKYGSNTHINYDTHKLCKPPKGNKIKLGDLKCNL